MITKDINLETSMVKICGVFEKDFCIHILNVNDLQKNLKNRLKYPLRGLLSISTCLDTYEISNIKRNELIECLDEFDTIL